MRISSPNMYQSSLSGVLNGQERVQSTSNNLITNKRLLTAADGPANMSKTMYLSSEIKATEQHQNNATVLNSALNFEESALSGMVTAMQRARVLGVQSGDGLMGEQERLSMAKELEQVQAQLLNFMNSQGVDGNYIFSGHKAQQQPYVFDGENYNYHGNDGKNVLKIASAVYVQANDTGHDVFNNVAIRNDVNDVTAGIKTSISDQRGYDTFHKLNYDPINTGNNTFDVETQAGTPETYQILDASGAVVANGNFTPGEAIHFNGIEIEISGATPAAEQFSMAPPTKDNVLNIVGDFINALRDFSLDEDAYAEKQANFLVGLDNAAEKVNLTIGSVGARRNSVDEVLNASRGIDIVNRETRASLNEVDFAKAVSDLQKAELALNTSYSAYGRVSQLSLFNYL